MQVGGAFRRLWWVQDGAPADRLRAVTARLRETSPPIDLNDLQARIRQEVALLANYPAMVRRAVQGILPGPPRGGGAKGAICPGPPAKGAPHKKRMKYAVGVGSGTLAGCAVLLFLGPQISKFFRGRIPGPP